MEQRPADKPPEEPKAPESATPEEKPPETQPRQARGQVTPRAQDLLDSKDIPSPAADQHAEAEPPEPIRSLVQRFAFAAEKSKFTRWGKRFEVVMELPGNLVLCAELEHAQPKLAYITNPPEDDEVLHEG
jgi:hypothetical protein